MTGFFQAIAEHMGSGVTAAWVISGAAAGSGAVFGRGDGGTALLYRDEAFPAEAAEKIRGLNPRKACILESGETRSFTEHIPGKRKLVICGGGHVALALVRICGTLDLDITVIEDREEYAGKAREAGADRVICRPFGEALDDIPGDEATAFVIMTREHRHDTECLDRILRKPFAYVGMMGSRSRTELIRRQMLENGHGARTVGLLHMPIGLAIGSRTPEEIAVSVAAELIQEMNAAETGEGFPEGMAEELAGGTRGTLAVIIEKNGEAPRKPGTKMLVRADGSILGTVGGGTAEAGILREAGEMIRTGCRESRLKTIHMTKGTMYCGGDITVFLMPL